MPLRSRPEACCGDRRGGKALVPLLGRRREPSESAAPVLETSSLFPAQKLFPPRKLFLNKLTEKKVNQGYKMWGQIMPAGGPGLGPSQEWAWPV